MNMKGNKKKEENCRNNVLRYNNSVVGFESF